MTSTPGAPATEGPGSNTGHGHVWPRPDRLLARCGGPPMCQGCAADQQRWGASGAPATEPAREFKVVMNDLPMTWHRSVYAVIYDGKPDAWFGSDHARADAYAQSIGGAVVALPIIADYRVSR